MSDFSDMIKFCDDYLSYDDGRLFWKSHWRRTELAGCEAGAKGRIKILGKVRQVHKVIFMMHNGYFNNHIVRVDGDKSNNRIENLTDNLSICKKPSAIDSNYIKSVLSYDEIKGTLSWRYTNPLVAYIVKGRVAGTFDNLGYRRIKFFGEVYFYHRLIWLYIHGDNSITGEIDHIDRNPSNNSLANLRLVSRKENARNRGTGKLLPESGHRGVRGSGPYGAFIGDEWIGTFDKIEDAISARKIREDELGYII